MSRQCRIVMSLFVALLLMVVSAYAAPSPGGSKTAPAPTTDKQATPQAPPTSPQPAASDNGGTPRLEADGDLTLRVAEPSHVAGEYTRNGVVIRFDSEQKGNDARLELRDAANAPLVTNTILEGTLEINLLGGRLRVVEQLQAAGGGTRTPPEASGDENAIRELSERAEYKALPYLSRALGARGIGGNSHPASLPLHLIAKASARAHKFSFDAVVPPPAALAQGKACYDQQGDPCKDDCFGMCGALCNCWRWVCGDCCINVGCLQHDVWCDDYICSGSKVSGAKCYGGPLAVYGAPGLLGPVAGPLALAAAYAYGCRWQDQPCTDKRTCDPSGVPDPRCERGIRNGNICCAASCGTCAGSGCSQRPGGANACCGGNISSTDRSCNRFPAPCVIELSQLPDPTCERGIRNGDACCAASCGTCAGSGCSQRPGGADACCGGNIQTNDLSCNTHPAPCLIDLPDPACERGIRNGNYCCAASCGTCGGGSDCSQRPGGANACCTGNIQTNDRSCNLHSAPCVIDLPDPKCERGIRDGNVCCAASCGTCGGSGCSQRPGGANACCAGSIQTNDRSCNTHSAPCVIQ